jgi:integrase
LFTNSFTSRKQNRILLPSPSTFLGKPSCFIRFETLERLGLPLDDREFYEHVFFDADELSRFIAFARDNFWTNGGFAQRRLFAGLFFATYTGVRRSEIARVHCDDINLSSSEPTVRVGLRKGRGDFELLYHEVPLHLDLAELLADWMEEMPAGKLLLFTPTDSMLVNGKIDEQKERTAADGLGKLLRRHLAGSEFQYCSGWHLHRHSLLTLIESKGYDLETAMALVNHRNRKVAQMYRHGGNSQTREVLNQVKISVPGVATGVNNPAKRHKKTLQEPKSLQGKGVSNRVRTGDLRNHNPAL